MHKLILAAVALAFTATAVSAGAGYTSSAAKARLAYYAALQQRLASLGG